jgi:hypothetical protein
MATTINASSFGAIANDSLDDSTAINAALIAAHAEYLKSPAAGRVTVVLPTGTLLVKGSADKSGGAISMLSGTALQGAGMGRTALKVADGWAGDITCVVRTPFDKVTSNVGLFDLSIDGNRDATTGEIDGFYTGVRPGSTEQDTDIHMAGAGTIPGLATPDAMLSSSTRDLEHPPRIGRSISTPSLNTGQRMIQSGSTMPSSGSAVPAAPASQASWTPTSSMRGTGPGTLTTTSTTTRRSVSCHTIPTAPDPERRWSSPNSRKGSP